MFETLNTRGKELEPKDLIKNLLAKLLPSKSNDLDTTKIRWSKMLENLSQSAANLDPSTYLHHFWLSKYDYTPEKTLFVRVKKEIDKSNASEFLNSIVDETDFYRRIFEPENMTWQKEEVEVKDSLQALTLFKVKQSTPLVLSLLRAYYSKKISLKQLKITLKTIENFHFAYTAIAGQSSSGGVSKMYAAAARDLHNEPSDNKRGQRLQDFSAKLKQKSPDLNTFLSGFSALRFGASETKDRQLIRYVLTRIDRGMRVDQAIDYSKMTIEHIAPQNPNGGTPVHNHTSIGNLVLVDEKTNGVLKNKSFSDKKNIFEERGVAMDCVLGAASSWSEGEINDRTKLLAELIYCTIVKKKTS